MGRCPDVVRRAASLLTIVIAVVIVFYRWVAPPPVLGGSQPGLGRTLGDWPDSACAFVARHPPPGRMMNMPWSLGNPIAWLLPGKPVFVDSRFESYPRSFLMTCIESCQSDKALAGLIEQWRPGWIFADHRPAGVLARVRHLLSGGQWLLAYVDCRTIVLVSNDARGHSYLASLGTDTQRDEPADLLVDRPALAARQRIAYARALHALGDPEAASRQLGRAAVEAAGDVKLLRRLADTPVALRDEFPVEGAGPQAGLESGSR
jgi:hypothetical protein